MNNRLLLLICIILYAPAYCASEGKHKPKPQPIKSYQVADARLKIGWIQTPNGSILIRIKDKHDTVPKMRPDGTMKNFVYIDDTGRVLPENTVHWAKEGPGLVRVSPYAFDPEELFNPPVPPKKIIKRPSAGPVLQTRVATCALLKEDAYATQTKQMPHNTRMYLDARQKNFESYTQLLTSCDIICFQEFAISGSLHLTRALYNRPFNVCIQEEAGLCIAINPNAFNIIKKDTDKKLIKHGFQVVLVETNDMNRVGIAIINTQLHDAPEKRDDSDKHSHLRYLADYTNKLLTDNVVQAIILMGNFNRNGLANSPGHTIMLHELSHFKIANDTFPTGFGADKKLGLYDYIFYTPLLRLVPNSVATTPTTNELAQQLITYSDKDAKRTYFSDHAFVYATLSLQDITRLSRS